MSAEAFHFAGLESVRLQMMEKFSDLSYIAIFDRTDRRQEDSLGRFDVDEDAVRIYLAAQRAAQRGDEAGADDLAGVGVLTRRDRIETSIRWLSQLVIDNMADFPVRRFRVRLQGLKGIKPQNTVMVTCTNREARKAQREQPERGPRLLREVDTTPAPTPAQAENLAGQYARFGEILIDSMTQIQRVSAATIDHLSEQLSDSRDQVDQLVAAILERNVSDLRTESARVQEVKEADTRTALARDALKQLGDATKTFLTAKGLPPEMSEVFQKIGQSPELMSALNDPRVRELMNNPGNLKDLSELLLINGQAHAAKAAAQKS